MTENYQNNIVKRVKVKAIQGLFPEADYESEEEYSSSSAEDYLRPGLLHSPHTTTTTVSDNLLRFRAILTARRHRSKAHRFSRGFQASPTVYSKN